MFGIGKKGFRQPKKLSRKQQEAQDKSTNFIKAYEEVCKEHGLQLDAKIEVTPDGVVPRIRIMEFQPQPQVKDWDECKKENEETRKRLKEEAKGEDRGEEEENGDDKNV